MTLAAWSDYTHGWQLLPALAYVLVWLFGGTTLTRRALRRHGGLPPSKTPAGRCLLLNFLANGAGAIGAAIVLVFFLALSIHLGRGWIIAGAVLGPMIMLLMGWLLYLAMLEMPPAVLWRITLATTAPLLAVLVAVGLGVAGPAYFMRQPEVKKVKCKDNLRRIRRALNRYAVKHPGLQAQSLQELLARTPGGDFTVHCPARPDVSPGYLYVPGPKAKNQEESNEIRVCDKRGNHGDMRLVLFADDRLVLMPEKEFQKLLARPENAPLRELEK